MHARELLQKAWEENQFCDRTFIYDKISRIPEIQGSHPYHSTAILAKGSVASGTKPMII